MLSLCAPLCSLLCPTRACVERAIRYDLALKNRAISVTDTVPGSRTWQSQQHGGILSKLKLLLRLVAAGILLQTLFFKFTGAPESKFIFSALGAEPWGRIFAGVSELISAALLLAPSTAVLGAAMALGTMMGAIGTHLFVIGVEVQGDGGLLFGLACVVTACSIAILRLERAQLYVWLRRLGAGRIADLIEG